MLSNNSVLARMGGVLYLVVAVGGGFSELYARKTVTVPGDAAATAASIAQHAALFRAGFIADLVDFTCFLGVGLVLYWILRPVSPRAAVAMLSINAVSVAIQALNMVNHVGALLVATDPRFTGMRSGALFLLELHHQGYLIAQIFFGLYLLPLGYLVYKSGLFPRALGLILVGGSAGYVGGVAAALALPDLQSSVALYLGMAGGVAETLFLLWLLIKGAHDVSQGELAWAA